MADQRPVNVFISYANKDEAFCEDLKKHLISLQRKNVIATWHDRKIDEGSDWQNNIDENLENVDIILLLISADFLASDYCFGIEVKRAMQRHENKSALVIPVLLRPCDTNGLGFMSYACLPKNFKPISTWSSRDEAYLDVIEGIQAAIDKLYSLKNASRLFFHSFNIENYRLFNRLNVKRLSRVNLLVGRNNVGKSAFLEAVYIYASHAQRNAFNLLIKSRAEHWDSNKQMAEIISLNSFRHFFKNHKLPSVNETGIKLSSNEESNPLHIKTAAYITDKTDEGFTRKKLTQPDEFENMHGEIEICVVSEKGAHTKILTSEELFFKRKLPFSFDSTDLTTVRIQFVSTQGILSSESDVLWSDIELTDAEDIVIDGLKLIEPRMQGLAFVKSEGSGENRTPLVKLQGQEERISLKSLGDGVSRVFHIMLALVNAQNGILLIDEFENGLHWKVQESVWRVLFQMAARLNVQVFCTTHSRDCINAFNTIWHEFENEGAFFRLYSRNDQIQVREYDLEALSASIETDVEVR